MNIKTAVTLGIGLFAGFVIFGDDEPKEKLIGWTKRKLKWLLYADKQALDKPKPVVKSYVSYSQKPAADTDDLLYPYPVFATKEGAQFAILKCLEHMNDYGTLSVHELCMYGNAHADYAWDNYGWEVRELDSMPSPITPIKMKNGKWRINIPLNPKSLYDMPHNKNDDTSESE